MHKIFISYSRHDKEKVFKLKDEIESLIGKKSCWIDLTGIESDKQFIDVIIDAIDKAEVFLFMYSKHSDASEWTRKEVEYAKGEGKRIVFVKIDKEPLSKYYRFQFSGHDIIDIYDCDQKKKLLHNLMVWVNADSELVDMENKSIDARNIKGIPNSSTIASYFNGYVLKMCHNVIAFLKWFTYRRSWVIMINVCNILFAILMYLGVGSDNDNDEDIQSILLVLSVFWLIPSIACAIKPRSFGFQTRWKSFAFLVIPVCFYALAYIECLSLTKAKENAENAVGDNRKHTSFPRTISIYRFDNFPLETAKNLEVQLREYFPNVQLKNEVIALPFNHYSKERDRFRASGLLDELAKYCNNDAVIGLTDYIIFTSKNKSETYGVMGMSYVGAYKSVISSKIPLNGKTQTQENLCKYALNELGHGFGLNHCANKGCYMVDSEGGVAIAKATGFCKSCKLKLNSKGWNIN